MAIMICIGKPRCYPYVHVITSLYRGCQRLDSSGTSAFPCAASRSACAASCSAVPEGCCGCTSTPCWASPTRSKLPGRDIKTVSAAEAVDAHMIANLQQQTPQCFMHCFNVWGPPYLRLGRRSRESREPEKRCGAWQVGQAACQGPASPVGWLPLRSPRC